MLGRSPACLEGMNFSHASVLNLTEPMIISGALIHCPSAGIGAKLEVFVPGRLGDGGGLAGIVGVDPWLVPVPEFTVLLAFGWLK